MKNILGQELPKILYRYMPWGNGTERNYAKELLLNKEIFMQTAENFNDPFDAANILIMSGSGKLLAKRYEEATQRINQGNYNGKRRRVNRRIRRLSYKERNMIAEGHMKESRKTTGIFCLSEFKENILLWSHYGDSHKGICLAFKTDRVPFSRAMRVEYKKEYPKANYLKSNIETIIRKKYLTKAIDWEYEHEYRVILTNSAKKSKKFSPETLTEIYCGCNMKEENIEDLKKTLQTSGICVPVYQFEKGKFSYELKVKAT